MTTGHRISNCRMPGATLFISTFPTNSPGLPLTNGRSGKKGIATSEPSGRSPLLIPESGLPLLFHHSWKEGRIWSHKQRMETSPT
jgi:hypothetical protein